MKTILNFIFILFFFTSILAQEKFSIKSKQLDNRRVSYQMVDEKGKVFKELDTATYIICFNEEQLGHFAVFARRDTKGWTAIDKNENILFEVYNNSLGEPSPDWLVDRKIRIVDKEGKIGFANDRGKIIIKPQFEIVSTFHNGKAIIGELCEQIPWDKHPEDHSAGCQHYSIKCNKHGYIDEFGKIILLGNFTFEQIAKKIHWKNPDY